MEKRYNFWVYVERSEGNPKIWVGHCLRLDVVSWGASPAEARDMVREAVESCILDDLNQGLDPLDRRPAPEECWTKARELQEIGRPVDVSVKDVAERERVSRFLMTLSLSFVGDGAAAGSPAVPKHEDLAWPSLALDAA